MLVFLQGWVGTEEPAEPEASGAYISRKEGFVLAAEADKTALFWGDFSHAFWHLQDNWFNGTVATGPDDHGHWPRGL